MPRSCPPLHPDLGMSGMSWDLSRTLWAEMYRGLRGHQKCSATAPSSTKSDHESDIIWWSASIPGILASMTLYNLQGERKQVCFPPQKLQSIKRSVAIKSHTATKHSTPLHRLITSTQQHAHLPAMPGTIAILWGSVQRHKSMDQRGGDVGSFKGFSYVFLMLSNIFKLEMGTQQTC